LEYLIFFIYPMEAAVVFFSSVTKKVSTRCGSVVLPDCCRPLVLNSQIVKIFAPAREVREQIFSIQKI